MSAEFVFAKVNVTLDKSHWLDRIRGLDDTELESFVAETDDQFYWADRVDHPASDLYSYDFLRKVADAVVEAVQVSYDYDYNRELGWFKHGEDTLVVTGGMSWGDAPTDAFDSVRVFEAFQYWDEAIRNKEDN